MNMGLNIGIKIKKQHDSYGNDGVNPRGSKTDIEESIDKLLAEKLGDDYSEVCFPSVIVPEKPGDWYEIDIRLVSYGNKMKNHGSGDIIKILTNWAIDNFGHLEGIELKTYWSG